MTGAVSNAFEAAARAKKVDRIVRAITSWKDASLGQIESMANCLAAANAIGDAFARAVESRLGESKMSLTTRAEVATRLQEFVDAARARGAEGAS